jgi:hypothetical protein
MEAGNGVPGLSKFMAHVFCDKRNGGKGWYASSAKRRDSSEFPDAIPCLHGVPTSLGSGTNGSGAQVHVGGFGFCAERP